MSDAEHLALADARRTGGSGTTGGPRRGVIRGGAIAVRIALLGAVLGLGAACDPAFIPPDHCGDAIVDPWEECDDGDLRDNDGCSETCTVEAGWDCTGEPSDCTLQ